MSNKIKGGFSYNPKFFWCVFCHVTVSTHTAKYMIFSKKMKNIVILL